MIIIKGKRRGGARQLADHLLRRDTNEDVIIREIDHYPAKDFNDHDLKSVLRHMAAQGQAKGKLRILYHAIIAPQEGEALNTKQLKYAVDLLAKNLGMEGHQRVVVEHHKAGRQHFHVVFNMLHPSTGKQARLQWSRKAEWKTCRQLEKEFNLKPMFTTGRPARRWECERGKRSGIDPLKVRKEVTSIYKDSKTGHEFAARLYKAGYVLTKGKNSSYVLVDRAGHIHGLMRRIEGAKLKDFQQKFSDLEKATLPPLNGVLKKLQHTTITQKSGRFFRNAAYIFRKATNGFVLPPRTTPSRPVFKANLPALMVSARNQILWRVVGYISKIGSLRNSFPIPRRRKRRKLDLNKPIKLNPKRAEMERAELIHWAFENGRFDILAQFGYIFPPEMFEP